MTKTRTIIVTGNKPLLFCAGQFCEIVQNGYILEANFEVRITGVSGHVNVFAVPGTKITRLQVGSDSLHFPAVTEVEVPE